MKKNNDKKNKKPVLKLKDGIIKTKKQNNGEKRTATFSLVEMIVVVIVVSLVVSVLSGYIIFKNYNYIFDKSSADTNYSELSEFINLYKELKEKYVEDVKDEDLINAAIDGMLNYLDVYSDYLDIDTTTNLQDRLNGEYKGVGIEISNNIEGNVFIVTVFAGSPAEEAGLKPGDVIVAINGESMLGKTSSEIASTIKSSSSVSLTYKRAGSEKTVDINTSNIVIPSVEYKTLENNIGYIKLSTFSSNTYAQTKTALTELDNKKITSLIIDVRDNSGGYLDAAKNISDLFLEKGQVIYQLKYKDDTIKKFSAKTADKTSYPIVVLMNGASASASEILAAALKENYGATLIGTKTFGKGTVQETEILSNGSMIKYTSAYWLTPTGKSINGVGLEPDTLVENKDKEDSQLKSAIEALK